MPAARSGGQPYGDSAHSEGGPVMGDKSPKDKAKKKPKTDKKAAPAPPAAPAKK